MIWSTQYKYSSDSLTCSVRLGTVRSRELHPGLPGFSLTGQDNLYAMKTIVGEFLGFVIVGAINTALTYALFLFIQQYVHYWIAYTIAFVIGIVLSYLLNVVFVFKSGHSINAMFKF